MASSKTLPIEARTCPAVNGGRPIAIAEDTLQSIIKARLAHPLVNQRTLAKIAGVSEVTVCKALNTPYAIEQVSGIRERGIDALKDRIIEAQYAGVQYYERSITRGLTEIDKKVPLPQVLSNARACTDSVSQITGVLKSNIIHIQNSIDSPEQFTQLPELEQDTDVSAFLAEPDTTDSTAKEQ